MEGPATPVSAVAALSNIGRPNPRDGREYVEPFGLTVDDVPALVELAKRWLDEAHFEATHPTAAMWGPIHAWRALGELRQELVIPMFLEMLDPLDRSDDDWFLEEFPPLCEQFGASVVELLVSYLLDTQHTEFARVAVAHGLRAVVGVDPSTRDRVCDALATALRPLSTQHSHLNAFLISYLAELEAVEHAELIERAFRAGVVDEAVCGDWREIALELGLEPPPLRAARAPQSKVGKSAQKRQRQARKNNRRR